MTGEGETMPRFRFTIRRMMIAVAIVGLTLGLAGLWRRSKDLRRLAEEHDNLEQSILPVVIDAASTPSDPRLPQGASIRSLLCQAEYHRKLSRKYWRASARPWLAVEADPPEPK
jgi:hypothetical protein